MNDLLHQMVKAKASDLHIKAGSAPGFRIDGEIVPQEQLGKLTAAQTRALAEQIMTPEQTQKYGGDRDLDFSYAVKQLARFRVNVMTQRSATGLVIRQIPDKVP